MARTITALAAFAIALSAFMLPAHAVPEPAEVPLSWELDVRIEKPIAISAEVPGSDEKQVFWYLRYEIINRTGEDRDFVPEIFLYTDTGHIVRADASVPSAVYDKIRKLHNDPLMRKVSGMAGKVLQGEDNSKRGVAVFRDFDPKAGGFDIFIGGLSGETQTMKLPAPIEVVETDLRGNKKKVVKDTVTLNKTLQLTYDIFGEAAARPRSRVILEDRKWVMR
ncbi:MAG: hypothetical protein ACLFVU_09920 [Phycisphaerae bacterium]